jgi:hypothetical protein
VVSLRPILSIARSLEDWARDDTERMQVVHSIMDLLLWYEDAIAGGSHIEKLIRNGWLVSGPLLLSPADLFKNPDESQARALIEAKGRQQQQALIEQWEKKREHGA